MIFVRAKYCFYFFGIFISSFAARDLHGYASDSTQVNESDPSSFYFFPLIYWTPQTKLAGGIVGTYVYRPDGEKENTRYSTLSAAAIYTQRKQMIFNAGLKHFVERRRFSVDLQYMEYPDWFWGIGNHTPDTSSERYTPRQFSASIHFSRMMRPNMYFGILYEFELFRILYFEPGGLWHQLGFGDQKYRITSGVGPTWMWDMRDHTLFPTTGHYHQLSLIPFASFTGSPRYFVRFRFDFRKYQTFFNTHILAGQIYGHWLFGKATINQYAEFGDYSLMRGYYPGRYRDRQMMAAQIEYRLPLVWRFGMTAFAGLGDVAPTLAGFLKPRIKTSQGVGIRFTINRDKHLNLRLDLAIRNKSLFPILAFGESF